MADLTDGPSACCAAEQQATCCEPDEKAECCGHSQRCGCDAGSPAPEATGVREQVRERYAAAARSVAERRAGGEPAVTACSKPAVSTTDASGEQVFGGALYEPGEAARVLRAGGRLAISDVIADEDMDDATRADMQKWTGCIAGALTKQEFVKALVDAGLVDVEISETHRVHERAAAAIVRASKPTGDGV